MGVGGTVRTVGVELVAKIGSYVTNLKTAGQATKAFSEELLTLSETSKAKFNDVMKTGLVVGAALTAVFIGATKAASDFDHQMSAVGAVMDKQNKTAAQVAAELGQLRQAAIVAGRDTVFSATQAAQAEEELAKAGLSTKEILEGGLSGALSLASAGALDLADAATITAKALNTFELSGDRTAHVADVLTAAANTSATDVKQLGLALSQSGNVANDLGLTLEDTSGVLALFAQKGLTGSDAGTSFKTMLQSLNPTADKTIALMKSLGLNFYDQTGKFIGITAVAGQLHTQLGKLSDQERTTAINTIFGSDAARAADIVYRAGAQGVQGWISGVNQSGIASKTAAERMDNLQGDVEQLRGSLETLAISSGEGATKGLRQVAQAATGTVNAFMDLPNWLQQTITDLAGLGGGSILALTGLVKVKSSIKETKDALEGMGPAGTRASKALSGITKWGGYAAIAGVAIFGVVELFNHLSAAARPAKLNIDSVTDALATFALTGQATGDLAKAFGTDLAGVGTKGRQLLDLQFRIAAQQAKIDGMRVPNRVDLTNLGNSKFDQAAILTQFSALDQGLANLVKDGNTTAAANEFATFKTELKAAGLGIDAINALFPTYTEESKKAAAANVGVAKGFASVSQQSQIMTDGLQGAIEKGKTLETVFKELNGAAISTTSTTIDYKNSLATLAAAVAKNKKEHDKYATSLSLNTQTGRDNVSMILDSIDKANKSAEAVLEQTGSVDKANAVWTTNIQLLKDQLSQLGFTPQQIQAVIDAYAKMPPVAKTELQTPGLDAALVKLGHVIEKIDTINGKKVVVGIHSNIAGNPFDNRVGGVYTHAASGLVSAGVYPETSPALYAFAERGTGGEGFVPRHGDYGRSTSIIDTEARWYGGRFVPGGNYGTRGGDGAYSPSVTYAVYPQQANFTTAELQALTAAHDAHLRVGRRH